MTVDGGRFVDLLGRDEEFDRLVSRLRTRRLVTVTGPGGIGKSALARKAAETMAPEFPLGAVHIDLTRVDYDEAVGGLFASQLGRADFDSLLNTPVDRGSIIVVDNCEHVLDEVASVISRLLEADDKSTVLATSRSPLDLPEESILTIGPLTTPGPAGIDLTAPALRLLVDRAADHGVDLDLANEANEACQIVERLDGMPLAIELAAAKLRSMTLGEIAADLEAQTHTLARPRFRGRPQHRSVADLVSWSFDRLTTEHTQLLENLAVFAGPFTTSMAAQIAPDLDPSQVRGGLDELVNTSLISRDGGTDGTWFRLLHPVRAVARHRLNESGRATDVESRYVDHVVSLTVEVIVRSRSGWDSTIVADLLSLYDNMTAALRWSLENETTADRAQLLVAVLWGVIHQAHASEIADLGEAVLQRWPDDRGPNWADARATVATCRNQLGDAVGAIELAEATLAEVGDGKYASATLRRALAQANRALIEIETAATHFEQAAIAAETANMDGLAMELWADCAALQAEVGDVETAHTTMATTLARASKSQAEINLAWCLAVQGHIHLHQLRHARSGTSTTERTEVLTAANQALDQAVELSRSIDYPAGTLCGLRGLCAVRLLRDNRVEAAEAALEMLDELQQHGNLIKLRMVLDAAAMVLERSPGTSWAALAATSRLLPITNVVTPVHSELPEEAITAARPLSIREAFQTAREELLAVIRHDFSTLRPASERSQQSSLPPDSNDVDDQKEAAAQWLSEGDVYRIDFLDKTIRLRKSKGLSDLVRLLQQPNRETLALELMGASFSQDALPAIDIQTRRSYEERLLELRDVIEVAESDNDMARAEQAQLEFDTLVDELTKSIGLGGRDRGSGGDGERARSAVTRRIRDAIKRITAENKNLGRHLDASIKTGTYCSYSPEHDPGWRIETG